MAREYVHGYNAPEAARLLDQASTLTELLHGDTAYPAGSLVLEAGCGVGAQTVTLAAKSPQASFVSVDLSPASLERAKARVGEAGLRNVKFQEADIYRLPFSEAHFDHVFVCFVWSTWRDRSGAGRAATGPEAGGTLTVIEGDHGSAYFHPDSEFARRAVQGLVELQRRAGGDALIGRRLYPLLVQAGVREVRVSPRMVYVDASRRPSWTASSGRPSRPWWRGKRAGDPPGTDRCGVLASGIRDLYRTAEADGTFCYTFFKAIGVK